MQIENFLIEFEGFNKKKILIENDRKLKKDLFTKNKNEIKL